MYLRVSLLGVVAAIATVPAVSAQQETLVATEAALRAALVDGANLRLAADINVTDSLVVTDIDLAVNGSGFALVGAASSVDEIFFVLNATLALENLVLSRA